MADSSVATAAMRYFCHQCSHEFTDILSEYICPTCHSGFIEAIDTPAPAPANDSNDANESVESFDPFTFNPLMFHGGRSSMFSAVPNNNNNTRSQRTFAGTRPTTRSQTQGGNAPRSQQATFNLTFDNSQPPQVDIIQHLLNNLIAQVLPQGNAPFMFQLHGDPGDYAWGPQGLDSIITALLNQMENAGPPPAPDDMINHLPEHCINNRDIDKTMQCSVCMEDFSLSENVKKLPCGHLFHEECIVPWLKMHGTCPVCRKTLQGEDTSQQDYMSQSRGQQTTGSERRNDGASEDAGTSNDGAARQSRNSRFLDEDTD